MFMKVQKHAYFHTFSPFSAYFSPLHHSRKGSITLLSDENTSMNCKQTDTTKMFDGAPNGTKLDISTPVSLKLFLSASILDNRFISVDC